MQLQLPETWSLVSAEVPPGRFSLWCQMPPLRKAHSSFLWVSHFLAIKISKQVFVLSSSLFLLEVFLAGGFPGYPDRRRPDSTTYHLQTGIRKSLPRWAGVKPFGPSKQGMPRAGEGSTRNQHERQAGLAGGGEECGEGRPAGAGGRGRSLFHDWRPMWPLELVLKDDRKVKRTMLLFTEFIN